MAKLRILLVADLYYPPTLGGSAIAFRRLAHGLAGLGHEVWIVAPGSKGLAQYEEQDGATRVLRCRSFPDPRVGPRPSATTVRLALLPERAISEALDRLRPSIVHLQAPGYAGAVAAKLAHSRGIPVVGTCHSIPENYWSPKHKASGVYRAIEGGIWELIRSALASCDMVCAPTMAACDLLHDHGLPRQAVPISNGVDLAVFSPVATSDRRRLLKERFHWLPTGVPTILYCGRFCEEKRLDVLLDAIPQVLSHVPAHFAFVGSGPVDVHAELAGRGATEHATVSGTLDDQLLPLAYQAADCLVLPSGAELQGIVLLEAAASGLPLVGANALAIPEIIKHGITGFLHVPDSASDLAERLVDVAADEKLRLSLGANSRKLALRHSLLDAVKQYEEIYLAVTAPRRLRT